MVSIDYFVHKASSVVQSQEKSSDSCFFIILYYFYFYGLFWSAAWAGGAPFLSSFLLRKTIFI